MNKIAFVMLVLFCSAITHAQGSHKRKITVLPASNLTIIGDSNIAKFQCEFNTSYLEKSQVVGFEQKGNQIEFSEAILPLNNKGFDCGSKGINRDFHDLLKTDKHPRIFLELDKVVLSSPARGIATVRIIIAEKQKSFEVPVVIEQGEISRFKGDLELNIKDYNLEAPKKLFGMIVVKDVIEIDFDLLVKI